MDPFLESRDIWPAFHEHMIATMHQYLLPTLDENSQGQITERRYTTEALSGSLVSSEVLRENYLGLYDTQTGSLITLIDMVSPANKSTDSGRQAYLHTLRQARNVMANCIVIDLVLQGNPIIDYSSTKLPDYDYTVTVVRSNDTTHHELYTVRLDKPLPRFRMPTSALDNGAIVDLQRIFDHVYEQGAFKEQIVHHGRHALKVKAASWNRLRQLLHPASGCDRRFGQ
jgi:hypothetical protein